MKRFSLLFVAVLVALTLSPIGFADDEHAKDEPTKEEHSAAPSPTETSEKSDMEASAVPHQEGDHSAPHQEGDHKAEATDDDDADAKSLFLSQLNKPDSRLNTGITYWIELKRGTKKSRVSNKTDFKNGDNIQFHVTPNISGFAYILMMKGSKGDQSVLFPGEGATANKISSGQEIVLPTNGKYLVFDETPGLETLRLLVSRSKIDPNSHLSKPGQVRVASSGTRTKSLIPDDHAVSIVGGEDEDSDEAPHKNLTLENGKSKPDQAGTVTVVSRDPSRLLSVDVALNHKQ